MKTFAPTLFVLLCGLVRIDAQEVGPFLPAADAEKNLQTWSYDLALVVEGSSSAIAELEPSGRLIYSAPRKDLFPGPPGAETALFGRVHAAQIDGIDVSFGGEDPSSRFRSALASREMLASTIEQRIMSKGLDAEGQRFWWVGSTLHARATAEAHEELRGFLAALDEAAGVSFQIDCLLVPPELLDKLIPSWRSAGPWLSDGVFNEALLDPASRLLTVVARNGQKVASGSKEIVPLLVDQEISSTGAIPENNPVVETPPAGDRLEVCPFLLPAGKAVWLDLAVGRFKVTAEKKSISRSLGDLECPAVDQTLISTCAVAVGGKVLVLGCLDAERRVVALARVRVRQAEKPDAAPGPLLEQVFRTHDATLLLRDKAFQRWPSDFVRKRFLRPGPRFGDPEELFSHLGLAEKASSEVDGYSCQGSRLWLSAVASVHEEVERRLEGEIGRLCRMAAIDVDICTVPRARLVEILGAAKDGLVLEEGWDRGLEGKTEIERSRYSLTGVAGQVHALLGARIKSFIDHVEGLSGGTGYCIIERSDPTSSTCGDGLELRLQADFLPEASMACLKLEGAKARILQEREVKASLPRLSAPGTGIIVPSVKERDPSGKKAETGLPIGQPSEAVEEVSLTLPCQDVQYWNVEMTVPLGRDVILHTEAREGDAATILVARVRRVE